MRVLLACEESQEVCKAFRALGHEAYSCDIQDCSGGHPEWHIKDDVRKYLKEYWDLIVAFPPCTDLAVSGAVYWKEKQKLGIQQKSIEFFMLFANSKCNKVAIENPIGIMSSVFRKPDQIIQPYMFGDHELKTTCLWLKGLPLLIKTSEDLKPEPYKYIIRKSGKQAGKKYNYYWRQGKTAYNRSKTFPGIAKAMAEQWGNL